MKSWIVHNRLVLFSLVCLVFVAYANSLLNQFVSDDRAIVALVPSWSLGDVFTPIFAFLRNMVYSIAFHIGGLNPSVFRFETILFHIGSVVLVFAIFSNLQSRLLGFLVAVLFAVHPVLTEAITWISAGVYPQYSFFFLASLLAYILSAKRKRLYWISLLLFVFCLMSSERALVLGLVFPLFGLALGDIKKDWKKLGVYLLLSGFWAFLYSQRLVERQGLLLEQQGESISYNIFFVIPVAISSYLELIFWPDKLTLYHSELMFSQVSFVFRVLVSLAFLALTIYFYKKNRLIFFSLAFFVTTLLQSMVFSTIGVAWVVAERYVYLGALGIFVPVAYVFTKGMTSKKFRTAAIIGFTALVIILSIRTIARNVDWYNEDNLWLSAARTSPSSSQNHNNLGDYYGRHGNISQAAEEFKTAIALRPNYADAYHNLGNAYRDMGKLPQAIENYEKALLFNSKIWQSYQNIAVIYYQEGDYPKAKEYIEKGMVIDPQNPNLALVAGLIYIKTDEKEKGRTLLLQILQIDPNNQLAKQGLLELERK